MNVELSDKLDALSGVGRKAPRRRVARGTKPRLAPLPAVRLDRPARKPAVQTPVPLPAVPERRAGLALGAIPVLTRTVKAKDFA